MPVFSSTMNPDVAHKLLKVGEAFRIPGPFFSYEEIKMGNVNHTYKVNYIRDDGSGMAKIKSYLVQRVNTYAFQRPLELMSNIDKVTEYIHSNFPNLKYLHFHHTPERQNYLMDEDGFWRLSNYVPSVTFNSCDDLEIVRSAGQAFGDFQMMMSKFDASSLYYTIPDFHNTRKRYEKLKADMAADPCGRVNEVREELDWLLSVEDEACKLTDLYEAGELPLRVTHTDTKINNVLFDEETLKPLVVIDLDTVMPLSLIHIWNDRYKAFIEAIINVILSIALGIAWGARGIFFATILSGLLLPVWIEPFVLYKNYFKKPLTDYFRFILKNIIIVLLIGIVVYFLLQHFYVTSCLQLILKALVCLILTGILMLIIFARTPECRYFLNIARNLISKYRQSKMGESKL